MPNAFPDPLMQDIRARFCHTDRCPVTGERIFFENAGGALTLQSVMESTMMFSAIPDNQGRPNPTSRMLVEKIAQARADMHTLLNVGDGQIFLGESGTEVLFRMIRSACVAAEKDGGNVVSSNVEHPASRSAAIYWAEKTGMAHRIVPHNDQTGDVSPEAYARIVDENTRVITILHTSPVTGIGNPLDEIVSAIRARAPQAFIIVDGIQHAAHGAIDLSNCPIDGYAISPYKMFARHGFGLGWISDRLAAAPHERLDGAPETQWEFGTRDTGAYVALSDVVAYLSWLGETQGTTGSTRTKLEAAGRAIAAQERALCDLALFGADNLKGLTEYEGISVLAGAENPHREGLVSFAHATVPTLEIVEKLEAEGIRTHIRKADHYSGNILTPLGLEDCVRVSFCHYNSADEVRRFLSVMARILE